MHSGFLSFACYALLLIALIGTIASTVFLVLVLFASRRLLRVLEERRRGAPALTSYPGVTMLKPIHGLEPRMEENLEGYFRLDYPNYEIVFGCRGPEDAGLAVVSKLSERYPHVQVRTVF